MFLQGGAHAMRQPQVVSTWTSLSNPTYPGAAAGRCPGFLIDADDGRMLRAHSNRVVRMEVGFRIAPFSVCNNRFHLMTGWTGSDAFPACRRQRGRLWSNHLCERIPKNPQSSSFRLLSV